MERRSCAAVDRLLDQLRQSGRLEIRPVPRHGRRPGQARHNPYEAGVKRYEMSGMGIYNDDNATEPREEPVAPVKTPQLKRLRKTRKLNHSGQQLSGDESRGPADEESSSDLLDTASRSPTVDCSDLGLILPDLGVETDLGFGTPMATLTHEEPEAPDGYGQKYICPLELGFDTEEVASNRDKS